jgi:hypothetical protein
MSIAIAVSKTLTSPVQPAPISKDDAVREPITLVDAAIGSASATASGNSHRRPWCTS